jgi:hypothetical protein
MSIPLNPLVYLPGHFTTGATAHGGEVPLVDCFHDLKCRFLTMAMKRVQIAEDICPDVLARINTLVAFTYSLRTDSSVEVPLLEIFDSDMFVSRLNLAFPESFRMKGDMIDLTDEEETTDSNEIAELKALLKLNQAKVCFSMGIKSILLT